MRAPGAEATLLEPAAIPHYLLERGLLTAREVLDEGVRVVDASRSHRVSLTIVGEHGGAAVKQADPRVARSMAEIERESLVYGLASVRRGASATVPPCLDRQRSGVLVLGRVSPGETVLAHHHRLATLPTGVAAAIGDALARWHQSFARDELATLLELGGDEVGSLPAEVPWVFDVLESERSAFPWHDPRMRAVLAGLPRPPRFRSWLRSARRLWRRECLMHGDLRWDNCLLEAAEATGPSPTAPRVRLIDWEMADLGDPAWDLGGILQDYLSPVALAAADAQARHRAASALWRAYAGTADPASGAGGGDLLERSLTFAGVRLVQTSLEWANRDGPGSAAIRPLLETSLALLEQPDAVARDLIAEPLR